MLAARAAAAVAAAAGPGGSGSRAGALVSAGGAPPAPPRARRRTHQQQPASKRPRSTIPTRHRRPCCAVRALWGNNNPNDANNAGADDESAAYGGTGPFGRAARRRHSHNTGRRSADADRRRRALLDYALGVQPSEMDAFAASSPPAVVAAMRATVANMLGTLPPAYFEVRVLTEPQTLAHLFFSAAMTGWMFRNCVLRLELRSALAGAALDASPPPTPLPPPAAAPSSSSPNKPTTPDASTPTTWSPAVAEQYAPGAQKDRVEGEVLLWHLGREAVERVPAPAYMEGLEREVARLRAALADAQGAGRAGQAARAAAALLESPGGAGTEASSAVVAPAAAVGLGGPPAALEVVPPPASGRLSSSGQQQQQQGGNPLLEYLRALDAAALKDLTAGIGEGAAAAVDAFVARLLGVASARDGDALRRCDASECSAAELGRALFWLMVVGYTLRSLEMQLDLDGVVGEGALSAFGGKQDGGGGGGGGGGGLGALTRGWKWPPSL
jgi:hypothetical protein